MLPVRRYLGFDTSQYDAFEFMPLSPAQLAAEKLRADAIAAHNDACLRPKLQYAKDLSSDSFALTELGTSGKPSGTVALVASSATRNITRCGVYLRGTSQFFSPPLAVPRAMVQSANGYVTCW